MKKVATSLPGNGNASVVSQEKSNDTQPHKGCTLFWLKEGWSRTPKSTYLHVFEPVPFVLTLFFYSTTGWVSSFNTHCQHSTLKMVLSPLVYKSSFFHTSGLINLFIVQESITFQIVMLWTFHTTVLVQIRLEKSGECMRKKVWKHH